MIEVNIPLFGMASLEMPIAGETIFYPEMFKYKGLELLQRMDRVAEIVERLLDDRWIIVGEIFNLCAYKEGIVSQEEAGRHMHRLGILEDEVFITECRQECREIEGRFLHE